MASGPFKIRLKLSKPAEPRAELPQSDSKPQGRKRLRAEDTEDLLSGANRERVTNRLHQGDPAAAEPDKQPASAFAQPSIQSSGRDPPGGPAALPARPRLVIKGSFGGSSSKTQHSSGQTATQLESLNSEKRHREKKLHKEKKRKKHRERPNSTPHSAAQLPVEDEQAAPLAAPQLQPRLPSKGRAQPAQPKQAQNSPVRLKLEAPIGLPKVKAEPAATATVPGGESKPTASVKAASQAPSTGTGTSIDGLTQASDKPSKQLGIAGEEAVSKPDAEATAGDVERLINRLQRNDQQRFFRDPVTDAVAPGYTEVIKRPMSFSQMHERLANGDYTSWKAVQEDLETMFNNAMVFNGPKSPYHLKAREMMGVARKLLHTVRTTGQLEPRGRKPASSSRPPQPPAGLSTAPIAERRPERRAAATRPDKAAKPRVDKKKVAARKAAARAAASGVLAKPGLDDTRGDMGSLVGEQSGRATFPQLQGQPVETQWGALAGGASAEGVLYGKGRPVLRANFSGMLSLERYAKSVRAFGAKLSGFALELLEKKLAAAARKPEPKPLPFLSRPAITSAATSWGTAGATQLAWTPLAHGRPPVTPASATTSLPQAPSKPGAYQGMGGPQSYAVAHGQPHSRAQPVSAAPPVAGLQRPASLQGSATGLPQYPNRPAPAGPPIKMSGVSVKVEAAPQGWLQPRPNTMPQPQPAMSRPQIHSAPRPTLGQLLPSQSQAAQAGAAQEPKTGAPVAGTGAPNNSTWKI